MSKQPSLQVRNLRKSFGAGELRTEVLRGVSVDFFPEELTLILGPSGSGKTTLLSIASGLLAPDSGEVLALDSSLYRLDEAARENFRLLHTGFVFQGFNLFPALTALEQVLLPLKYMPSPPADARARALRMLEEVGIAHRRHLRPLELSGGEKQRVAIARAMIKEPALLFADEPTSALDARHGETVVKLLKKLAHEHRATVVCVTHDHRLIKHADRVIHVEDGQIVHGEYLKDPTTSLSAAH
jgi:putative ABC transport system ATP-binding protein